MQEPKKKTSQVPQTVDSSNEGPEDFRHQLPHLFLSGDSPNNRRKCQATFGMGILTTYPETLNGMVPKIPKKRIFKLVKSSHSSTEGGENLRICGDRWGQTTGPKNTKKWPQNIGTPMSFLQGAMHIKHGSHHAEPERCLYTREMRVAEVQADQKKVPQNRRKPKDIWHISAPLQTIGASLPEISIAWFITSQKKMSWNASTLVSALTLSAQISDPDGGETPY